MPSSPAPPVASEARHLLTQMAGSALPDWEEFACGIQVRRVAQGQTLFDAGQPWPWVSVVCEGMFKLVYLREDGSERIKSFIAAPGFFASLAGLSPEGRASFTAVAMTPSVVQQLSYPQILALAERHLAWQKAWRVAIEHYGSRKEKRERELLTCTPEERYRLFMTESPQLATQIPQKDLALYLGITPVGLSRLRGRLRGHLADARRIDARVGKR